MNTYYNMLNENIQYWWNPTKLLKHEIISGTMTSERIRYLIENNLEKVDSVGRKRIDEDSLKYIYTHNKNTIDNDLPLKLYIKDLIKNIRHNKVNSSKIYEFNQQSGCMEEIIISCVNISWID